MPLLDNMVSECHDALPFKVAKNHFMYLGLKTPQNPKLLFKLNYDHKFKAKHRKVEDPATFYDGACQYYQNGVSSQVFLTYSESANLPLFILLKKNWIPLFSNLFGDIKPIAYQKHSCKSQQLNEAYAFLCNCGSISSRALPSGHILYARQREARGCGSPA